MMKMKEIYAAIAHFFNRYTDRIYYFNHFIYLTI